jgi:hypothetical protein
MRSGLHQARGTGVVPRGHSIELVWVWRDQRGAGVSAGGVSEGSAPGARSAAGDIRLSSEFAAPPQPNAANMSKRRGKSIRARTSSAKCPATIAPDELLPEYDFSGGRPNKFAAAFERGCTMIVLEPDVAAAFPSAVEVNELLRAVASAVRKPRATKRVRRDSRKSTA